MLDTDADPDDEEEAFVASVAVELVVVVAVKAIKLAIEPVNFPNQYPSTNFGISQFRITTPLFQNTHN